MSASTSTLAPPDVTSFNRWAPCAMKPSRLSRPVTGSWSASRCAVPRPPISVSAPKRPSHANTAMITTNCAYCGQSDGGPTRLLGPSEDIDRECDRAATSVNAISAMNERRESSSAPVRITPPYAVIATSWAPRGLRMSTSVTTTVRTLHRSTSAASWWPPRAKPHAEIPSGVASAKSTARSRCCVTALRADPRKSATVTAMMATRTMAVIAEEVVCGFFVSI